VDSAQGDGRRIVRTNGYFENMMLGEIEEKAEEVSR
jgi:hypothetical protein